MKPRCMTSSSVIRSSTFVWLHVTAGIVAGDVDAVGALYHEDLVGWRNVDGRELSRRQMLKIVGFLAKDVTNLRYEDIQADPEGAFSQVLRHIGAPPDPERVARAVRFSAFDELSRQEAEGGFIERSPNSDRFFHSGQSGQWREQLAPEIAERIRTDHAETMREFGYLDG